MLVFGLDVTQRKQAETELLKALAREVELGQLRTSFVSMVSHEFRTPLGIIQSSAEILEAYLDRLNPDERREHLQSVHKNTRRMAALMEEVLLIGRLDAGKMDFKPAPLDLPGFARRLVDDVAAATDRRCPIELRVDALEGEAQADERLLQHILTNLITNAVKYSAPGQPVQVEMWREGTHVVSLIRDQGIGIPEPDRAGLFKAFHRGSNVQERSGTGLGLTIVKRCVDLHGGHIRLESVVGRGTSAIVRLPIFVAPPAS
jgi:signal transduction histidine kinase